MSKAVERRNSERGGAGVKFLIVATVLFLLGNAGYQWIPVAFSGENVKQDMQTAVVQGLAMPSRMSPIEMVKQKIQVSLQSNNIPADAYVEVKQTSNTITARVAFDREIPLLPFGLYNYHYQFDHTATPSGFLTKQ
jgi:hypothetical protein